MGSGDGHAGDQGSVATAGAAGTAGGAGAGGAATLGHGRQSPERAVALRASWEPQGAAARP